MTAAAVAEATGGSEPAGAQLGQSSSRLAALTSRGARAMSACPSARASAPRGRRPRLKLRLRPPGRRSDSWRRRGGDSGRRKRGRRPRHKDAQPWEAQSRRPRQRQSRQPPLQQPPQQPQRGVRTLFNDLASVMDEANLFADGVYCDMDDALPPLPEDFGSQEFYA